MLSMARGAGRSTTIGGHSISPPRWVPRTNRRTHDGIGRVAACLDDRDTRERTGAKPYGSTPKSASRPRRCAPGWPNSV